MKPELLTKEEYERLKKEYLEKRRKAKEREIIIKEKDNEST